MCAQILKLKVSYIYSQLIHRSFLMERMEHSYMLFPKKWHFSASPLVSWLNILSLYRPIFWVRGLGLFRCWFIHDLPLHFVFSFNNWSLHTKQTLLPVCFNCIAKVFYLFVFKEESYILFTPDIYISLDYIFSTSFNYTRLWRTIYFPWQRGSWYPNISKSVFGATWIKVSK